MARAAIRREADLVTPGVSAGRVERVPDSARDLPGALTPQGSNQRRGTVCAVIGTLIVILASPSGLSEALRGYTAATIVAVSATLLLLVSRRRGKLVLPRAIVVFLVWVLVAAVVLQFEMRHHTLISPWTTIAASVAVVVVGTTAVRTATLSEIKSGLVWGAWSSLAVSIGLYWLVPEAAVEPNGISGIFGHKNILGFVLVIGFIAALLKETSRAFERLAVMALLILGAVWSESATAVIAMVFGVFIFYALKVYRRVSRSGIGAFLFWVITSPIAALAVLATLSFDGLLLQALGRTSTLSGRTGIWEATLGFVEQRPWAGWGYGMVWGEGSSVAYLIQSSSTFAATHAHSGYLDLLLQTGIVGTVLFASVIVVLTVRSVRIWTDRNPAGTWLLVQLFAIILYNIVESRFFNLLGLFVVTVMYCIAKQERFMSDNSVDQDKPLVRQ